MLLTSDMRAVIETCQLCFAATVSPDGRPNLSPKGTIRVWDDEHLFFLDIASPQTRANLEHAPWLELNVVDQLSRRGYRFAGPTTLHRPGSAVYDEAVRRVYGDATPSSPPSAVVLLAVACLAIGCTGVFLLRAAWRGTIAVRDPAGRASRQQ